MAEPRAQEPPVSVVTPFYNTAPYLEECIQSVLAQSHSNFEYLLVNNKSTDGSREIAARWVGRDPRVRLLDNDAFVGQVENYNGALEHIAPGSKYVKVVQADDALYPDCLRMMVDLAEREPRVGLVSSYYLDGDTPMGVGLSRHTPVVPGREACRTMLTTDQFFVGTPTNVLYRADLVRARKPFYTLGRYHEDTEAAFEILLDHDLGFVHQILSFNRADNVSISSATRSYNPAALDKLILVERYAPRVLPEPELRALRAAVHRNYFRYLGRALLMRRSERKFWDYHRGGLATVGLALRWRDVVPHTVGEVLRLGLDPKTTLSRFYSELRRRGGTGGSTGAC
jgi:glycosyltransferase involved in cell wall biosynthesis